MNGYFVSFYRDADRWDGSLNGVSRRYSRAVRAVLYRGEVPANHPEDHAALVLDDKPITVGSRPVPRIRAVPASETGWTMFGGNFIWSCDSRFRREVSEYPIPVHDRIEQ